MPECYSPRRLPFWAMAIRRKAVITSPISIPVGTTHGTGLTAAADPDGGARQGFSFQTQLRHLQHLVRQDSPWKRPGGSHRSTLCT